MGSKITLFLILAVIWFVLSGFLKPLFIFFGITSTLICVLIYSKMQKVAGINPSATTPYYLKFSFISYVVWLVKEIIASSFKLALDVWREKPRIKPETSWVKHNLNKEEGVTLYANSITLTPGTVSIYTKKKEILVHAIHQDNIKDLKTDQMCNKVKKAVKDG